MKPKTLLSVAKFLEQAAADYRSAAARTTIIDWGAEFNARDEANAIHAAIIHIAKKEGEPT